MPEPTDREEQWTRDREEEARPLPGHHLRNYDGDEGARQVDLVSAERSNIARAAGELGLTSDEWTELRRKIGRSPTSRDVSM